MRLTDEEIIARVRDGETRLFEELVRRYQDRVYGAALRTTRSAHDAEDLVQEVFLSVFRGLEGFKGEARFSTWLYRIVFNRSADWVRRRSRGGRRETSLEEAPEAADAEADPQEQAEGEEERRRLVQELERLDSRYRNVVELFYYQGLSYQQVGEVLGVPVKTVETQLYRARRMLRARLEREREER